MMLLELDESFSIRYLDFHFSKIRHTNCEQIRLELRNCFYPLLNDKILNWSKLKAFADDKTIVI